MPETAGRITALGLALALAAAPVQAQPSDAAGAAREAVTAMQEATDALAEAAAGSDRVAALTRTIRAHEEGLALLRAALRRAAQREAAIRAELDARRETIAGLAGVMGAMERSQGPLLLLHPSGPLGTARAGMLLSSVTPALQGEARDIRRRLEEIARLRALQDSAAATLEEGLAAAQDARATLNQAIADRRALPAPLTDDPEAMRRLLTSADTLDAFADGLLGLPPAAEAPEARDFAAARGDLPLPVRGTVLRGFNEADAAGVRRPGLVIATRPGALVTAPWPATLRYRGPLLDYGNVMVLEPGEGYLLVLAGLEQVYPAAGEVISQGAALGLMGGSVPEFAEGGPDGSGLGAERSQTLYVELRDGTEPVDPRPWFAQTREE
ncbi:peptidase M23 [Rhodobacteraceae bacterium WD3A24]|nr:peptidase M23 [Rhodobacteraceae bacterium WD3A24]